jgi:Flp pilus assembly pilin Flp
MLKKLIQDESGLSTIEILVGMIVLVLLAIISFAALRGGIKDAASNVGTRTTTTLIEGSTARAVEGHASSVDVNPNVKW